MGRQVDSDYAPLTDTSIARRPVAAMLTRDDGERTAGFTDAESGRLLGTIVHRLIQRLGLTATGDDAWLAAVAAGLVRPEEALAADPLLPHEAAACYRAVCATSVVRDVYRSGDAFHEVPFTARIDGQIVRGTIDCLVRGRDRITVFDFKTGRPDPTHDRQMAVYRQAVEMVFPGSIVEARVIYARANNR